MFLFSGQECFAGNCRGTKRNFISFWTLSFWSRIGFLRSAVFLQLNIKRVRTWITPRWMHQCDPVCAKYSFLFNVVVQQTTLQNRCNMLRFSHNIFIQMYSLSLSQTYFWVEIITGNLISKPHRASILNTLSKSIFCCSLRWRLYQPLEFSSVRWNLISFKGLNWRMRNFFNHFRDCCTSGRHFKLKICVVITH